MARRSHDADRLEALLSGGLSEDEAPSSTVRLAGLATAVRDHTHLETPTDEFRTRLRAELLAAPAVPGLLQRARDRVEATTARWRHSARVAGAAAVASSMLGTTAVAAAAQSALPGDLLYGVKGFTEDARLALASGDVARGQLHLAFARERLEELEVGHDRLSPDQLRATFDALDVEAAAGAEELLAAAADGSRIELLDELDSFTAEVRERLHELAPSLPLSLRPATERTLEVLRRIELQVAGLLAPAACEACGEGTGSLLPRIVLPGDGPAVPTCPCVEGLDGLLGTTDGADATGDTGDPLTGPDPAPAEAPRLTTPPTSDSGGATDDGSGLVDDLSTAVPDVVEPIEDVGTIVDDLLDPSDGSSAGDLGSAVDDATSELDDSVSDVGSTVDDTASDVGDTVDDTVSDVGSTVDDTASTVEDTVDDTATELGDTVGDLGDGLTGDSGSDLLD